MNETHADHRDIREVPDLADVVFDETFWDGRYRAAPSVWSGRPNPQLVDETSGLTPGTALDVGCGEGADVAWLAGRGWTVTGVEISRVALERAEAHAREAGLTGRTRWLHLDATREPVPGTFDLVSAHFVHLPPGMRDDLHRRLAAATAPGGTLLVVAHHPLDLDNGVPRPPVRELFFTADDVAAVLDPREWTIVTSAARPRRWTDADGREWTLHDTILRARRRG
ncbi:Methyltransferase type 11 [Pseudonocardia dioxanivorans CB1190]|uniref:Methyltransferase type 11 n=1 Tax=Pseudonocardia dioxanivorans (strain ATCC 55486 / DSM 44775 / JCM 13855 / CB1190) TaxID=675635 RepID=F4CRR7_PSEUX|nr:class I SAM-dependent methyltransferase [Pseudonocardia dioxanivorans]AEA27284.1 Methyltransferase type 11 [Pseudonocardia dioxanivorans CB1190]